MRRSVLVFLLITVVILTFLLHEVSTLIALLLEDASADAIQKSELPAPNSTLLSTRPQLIPKIIHQTYINETIPPQWLPAQQACLDLHQDYEYILWTDAKSLEFIEKEYPWFAPTFRGYQHPIQRADSIRYFVLATYGGVYIDLDDGCKRRLDPLLSYNAFLRRTVPTGISNDVMGAIPQHPFFLRVIESLQGANRKWVLPYITIMASTGPLFLSVIWKKWMGEHADLEDTAGTAEEWKGRVRVLMPDEYSGHTWSFFNEFKGNSWHGKDAKLIFWMGKNWLLLTAAGTVIVLSLGLAMWWIYGRILLLGQKRRGYVAVGSNGSPSLVPTRGTSRSPRNSPRKGPSSLWKRLGMEGKKERYELVEQHDA
ncbi:CSG1/SUR1-like protein [Knufia obscura]|uniref:CSG1/SUR1-like protein n=2 Tax=Knufia TaxID=430999 RepID=A0AAN8EUE0_9EURO|nr:CSG1/SUR1-like protein [Knufia obscura]KAK5953911.1 CSG1/SUR1-like protein [Knufia fluminis]